MDTELMLHLCDLGTLDMRSLFFGRNIGIQTPQPLDYIIDLRISKDLAIMIQYSLAHIPQTHDIRRTNTNLQCGFVRKGDYRVEGDITKTLQIYPKSFYVPFILLHRIKELKLFRMITVVPS